MSEAIKTNVQTAQNFLTDLQESVGIAEVCLNKNIIEEPNKTALENALAETENLLNEAFDSKVLGSLLSNLEIQKDVLDQSIA